MAGRPDGQHRRSGRGHGPGRTDRDPDLGDGRSRHSGPIDERRGPARRQRAAGPARRRRSGLYPVLLGQHLGPQGHRRDPGQRHGQLQRDHPGRAEDRPDRPGRLVAAALSRHGHGRLPDGAGLRADVGRLPVADRLRAPAKHLAEADQRLARHHHLQPELRLRAVHQALPRRGAGPVQPAHRRHRRRHGARRRAVRLLRHVRADGL